MKKGCKQIFPVRRAFSNPQIYPGIPAITSGINRLREECVRNCLSVSGDSYLLSVHFIPLVHYCPGVRTFGSAPTHRLHPARPPFLSSCQSVCLSFLSSRSVPVPAGLADQEPGLPWQPVLSPSLDGSSPDCVPSFTTPQKCTPRTCTGGGCTWISKGGHLFSSLTLSPLFIPLNCNHNIFPFPAFLPPPLAPDVPESARSGSSHYECQLRRTK